MKNISEFLVQHPVFTRDELVSFFARQKTINVNTQTAIIQYHIKQGHVIRIKSGLFASIPAGSNPDTYPVDPYLIAGKAAPDAVLAYHTALEYQGVAYSVFNNFTFCTNKRQRSFIFQDHVFEAVLFPLAVRGDKGNHKTSNEFFATDTVKRQGIPIKLTNMERTFVDVLDQPHYSSGWEEICRSIEAIAVLNLDLVIQYAKILGKVTTIAKVGYFLEKMRGKLGVTESQLKILENFIPKQPTYLSSSMKKKGVFIKRWNLIVPETTIQHQWEEPNYDA